MVPWGLPCSHTGCATMCIIAPLLTPPLNQEENHNTFYSMDIHFKILKKIYMLLQVTHPPSFRKQRLVLTLVSVSVTPLPSLKLAVNLKRNFDINLECHHINENFNISILFKSNLSKSKED